MTYVPFIISPLYNLLPKVTVPRPAFQRIPVGNHFWLIDQSASAVCLHLTVLPFKAMDDRVEKFILFITPNCFIETPDSNVKCQKHITVNQQI